MRICPILNSECIKDKCVAFCEMHPEVEMFFNKPIEDLDVSVRARNILKSHFQYGIKTFGDLKNYGFKNLLKMKNCGKKSVYEIRERYYFLYDLFINDETTYICRALNCEIPKE